MRTYQEIESDINMVTQQTAQLAFMNKEQIYGIVAVLVSLSDELNNFIHENDLKMTEAESEVIGRSYDQKMTASMLSMLVKEKTAPFKADKEWADRQVLLLRDLRIAALAAQRSAEA